MNDTPKENLNPAPDPIDLLVKSVENWHDTMNRATSAAATVGNLTTEQQLGLASDVMRSSFGVVTSLVRIARDQIKVIDTLRNDVDALNNKVALLPTDPDSVDPGLRHFMDPQPPGSADPRAGYQAEDSGND